MEGGKPENQEKNPQSTARNNNKLNRHNSLGLQLKSNIGLRGLQRSKKDRKKEKSHSVFQCVYPFPGV